MKKPFFIILAGIIFGYSQWQLLTKDIDEHIAFDKLIEAGKVEGE